MAPTPITEDYYSILGVVHTASPEVITRSYKGLALKLHPDRNAKDNATEAFQLLGTAYDTLKDETKRRAYDLIYPFITKKRHSSDIKQTPRSASTSTPQTESLSESAQISALQESKQERSTRWSVKRKVFYSSICTLQEDIRQLEKEIRFLDTVGAAGAGEKAQQSSWGTWLLSWSYKKTVDSEEEKARKDREKQEKRIEKDMKERRLEIKRVALRKEEGLLRKEKEEIDAADMVDDEKIRVIQNRMWIRETLERRCREKQAEERREKFRKQQQEQQKERERDAAAAWSKQQAEEQIRIREILEWRRRERQEEERRERVRKQRQEQQKEGARDAAEEQKRKEDIKIWQRSTGQSSLSTCNHDGWWQKVQGRMACPECHDMWTYSLECPGCKMKACPKCRGAIRRRIRTTRRATAKVGTPSSKFFEDDYY